MHTLEILTLLSALALAQTAPQASPKADPMACAKAVDGSPIRIGMAVREKGGAAIGSVSLSQCSADANPAKLRVRLNQTLGGAVKIFDLTGVIVSPDAVMLPLTETEAAQAPAAPLAYATPEGAVRARR